MTHQIRLANAKDYPADRVIGLTTRISMSSQYHDSFDLIEKGIGETVPQGSLFAYLFRRFGYPNIGSDPHKNLASYILTTTRKDMLLQITPYAGGTSSISFKFMVDMEVEKECRDWEKRFINEDEVAFIAFISKQDFPDWAKKVIQQYKDNQGSEDISGLPSLEAVSNLVHLIRMVAWRANKEEISDHRVQWFEDLEKTYREKNPKPDFDYRGADWQQWNDEDPLKSYARDIIHTLSLLKQPVWVRDCPIDPWGIVDENCILFEDDDDEDEDDEEDDQEDDDSTENKADADSLNLVMSCKDVAKAAGYPSGDLGNQDPELFSQIHNAILALGKGDPILGMTRAVALLAQEEKKTDS